MVSTLDKIHALEFAREVMRDPERRVLNPFNYAETSEGEFVSIVNLERGERFCAAGAYMHYLIDHEYDLTEAMHSFGLAEIGRATMYLSAKEFDVLDDFLAKESYVAA